MVADVQHNKLMIQPTCFGIYCWVGSMKRKETLKPHLVSPFEDAQRVAGGEGPRRVLQAQHALLRVQGLVDVGVRLELEARVLAGRHRHPHPQLLLLVHLRPDATQLKQLYL